MPKADLEPELEVIDEREVPLELWEEEEGSDRRRDPLRDPFARIDE